jgi:uncharacterized protein (DUF58 family)
VTGVPAKETLLDPVILARIADLPLLARTVVEGFLHGLHRSARKGLSLDFAQHRPYQPGDDLRRIDWKAYARTDRFYVKEYDADTNAGVMIGIDVSGSMDFAGVERSVNKFAYAQMLAASLAWLAQHDGDRVGLAAFTHSIVELVPPSTRHLQLLLQALGRARPRGEGSIAAGIRRVADLTTRPGIVILITDCYEDPETLGRGIGTLRARGHDVVLFHLIDPTEDEFPFEGPLVFEDGENELRLPMRAEATRNLYLDLWGAHREALVSRVRATGAEYVALRTDQPLDKALHTFLDRRLATGRVR